jgi:hypothetical protein
VAALSYVYASAGSEDMVGLGLGRILALHCRSSTLYTRITNRVGATCV